MSPLFAILIFSAVIIGLEALPMIFRGKTWGATSARLVGLTVVALVALIITFSDLPSEQRSPAYALLGVVAGFLAGKQAEGGKQAEAGGADT